MSERWRSAALMLTLALCCAAPALAEAPHCAPRLGAGEDEGIGGTGFGPDDGMGGTGFGPAPRGDEGLGGTGIYGSITSRDPLCVNGLRIQLSAQTRISQDGIALAESALETGRVVWIEASNSQDPLLASSIEIQVALTGLVETLSLEQGHARVAGVEVWMPTLPGVAIAAGDSVAVSGWWRGTQQIVATRIDPIEAAEPQRSRLDLRQRGASLQRLSLEGYPEPGLAGTVRLHGLAVEAGSRAPVAGERVWLRGIRVGNEGLRPLRVQRPARPELPRSERPLPERIAPPTRPDPRPDPRPNPIDRPTRSHRIDRRSVNPAASVDRPVSR